MLEGILCTKMKDIFYWKFQRIREIMVKEVLVEITMAVFTHKY